MQCNDRSNIGIIINFAGTTERFLVSHAQRMYVVNYTLLAYYVPNCSDGIFYIDIGLRPLISEPANVRNKQGCVIVVYISLFAIER